MAPGENSGMCILSGSSCLTVTQTWAMPKRVGFKIPLSFLYFHLASWGNSFLRIRPRNLTPWSGFHFGSARDLPNRDWIGLVPERPKAMLKSQTSDQRSQILLDCGQEKAESDRTAVVRVLGRRFGTAAPLKSALWGASSWCRRAGRHPHRSQGLHPQEKYTPACSADGFLRCYSLPSYAAPPQAAL